MIRLNLGCGGPDKLSWHPLPEPWVNRDPDLDGWRFQDGLAEYADGSVEAVTVSHALMYLPLEEWPQFFADVARVLCDEGVFRITEDATDDTRSRTYPHGWRGSMPAITLTNATTTKRILREAGLIAHDCDAATTHFHDREILQDQHGGAPHCFYAEGIRMTRLLFEPHADDGALFASFTIMKYRPHVVTCFPSSGDYGSTDVRQKENHDALVNVLGAQSLTQWNGQDLEMRMRELDRTLKPSLVFACSEQASHPDHVEVARTARRVFGDRLRMYHTYDEGGKVRSGTEAMFDHRWIHSKLRALARFQSQIEHRRAHVFFLEDLREYLA